MKSQNRAKLDDSGGRGSDSRIQLTARMDPDLVKELDAFADRYGMSRNGAINMFVRKSLEEE